MGSKFLIIDMKYYYLLIASVLLVSCLPSKYDKKTNDKSNRLSLMTAYKENINHNADKLVFFNVEISVKDNDTIFYISALDQEYFFAGIDSVGDFCQIDPNMLIFEDSGTTIAMYPETKELANWVQSYYGVYSPNVDSLLNNYKLQDSYIDPIETTFKLINGNLIFLHYGVPK